MNAVLALVGANVRRLLNDRSNYFFLGALPLLILFSIGVAVGGSSEARVGYYDPHPTAASRSVLERMGGNQDVHLVEASSAEELRNDVARQTLDAGWSVQTDGGRTTYLWYSPGNGDAANVRGVLEAAVAETGATEQVGDVLASTTGRPAGEVGRAVAAASEAVAPIDVEVRAVGSGGSTPAAIRAVVAACQLTLFIFLTSLTGASYLLTSRQYGVTRRMRAGPVPIPAIIAGEALSRFLIAIGQGAIVVFGAMLIFGVDWRSPVAVALLCVTMALVGTGAAMLLGTLGRSEQQVGALALLLSLVLAALGGSMQPLEFFPDTLRRIAFITPHAWMNDAMWSILVDGAGLAQVWHSIVVLAVAGVGLLGLAWVAMARSLR